MIYDSPLRAVFTGLFIILFNIKRRNSGKKLKDDNDIRNHSSSFCVVLDKGKTDTERSHKWLLVSGTRTWVSWLKPVLLYPAVEISVQAVPSI